MEESRAELKEIVSQMTLEQFEWFTSQVQLLLFPKDD